MLTLRLRLLWGLHIPGYEPYESWMYLTATPKRSAIHQRSKSVAPSQQPVSPILVGDPETNRVRDRVRQWQAQGGGVIESDDVGPDHVSDGVEAAIGVRSKPKKGFAQTRPRTNVLLEAEAEKRTTAKEKTETVEHDGTQAAKTTAASVPTKRVVSDGHWRKKRSPPKSTSSSKVPDRHSPPHRPPVSAERKCPASEPRSIRRRKREQLHRLSGSRKAVLNESERDLASCNGSAEMLLADVFLMQSTASTRGEAKVFVESPSSPIGRGSSESIAAPVLSTYLEENERTGGICSEREHKEKEGVRSEKGKNLARVFGGPRKLFSKQTSEPTISTRGPGIEAWLDGTPDPFVEAGDAVSEKTTCPKPSLSDIQDTMPEPKSRDPNNIWGTLSTKEGTRRVVSSASRSRRVPSSAIYCDNPFPPDLDPITRLSNVNRDEQATPKLVELAHAESMQTSLKGGNACASPPPSKLGRKWTRINPTGCADLETKKFALPDPSSTPSEQTASAPGQSDPWAPLTRHSSSVEGRPLSTIAPVENFGPRRKRRAATPLVDPSTRDGLTSLVQRDVLKDSSAKPNMVSKIRPSESRVTKHSDLISILSLPEVGGRSVKSARSMRTNRARLETATEEDLMQEFAVDESKYLREIQTLVDGVIPVLLSCVFSKTASAAAAGLFQPSAATPEDPNFTKPIIDMGIALERLKTLHKRVPLTNQRALLTWAHGAQRVYAEYLKAWRLGFQDVVVNLAPGVKTPQNSATELGIDGGLPRDHNGDVVNSDGEKVDVAFLLKRPLVRLKYLAKTLKGISIVEPSAEASHLAVRFQDLVQTARLRANEERARLEDEAAANIDATRSRDPRTLAPLSGVLIDRTSRVLARDYFNLALQHSTGQRVDCRVELLIRGGGLDADQDGDLLICEVDESGRWLLFPPIKTDMVSARSGTTDGEIVTMIRGFNSDRTTWQELVSLYHEDERIGFEWAQMLGLQPVPPSVKPSKSFASKSRNEDFPQADSTAVDPLPGTGSVGDSTRLATVQDVNIPIGEQAQESSVVWSDPAIPQTLQIAKQGSSLDISNGVCTGGAGDISTNRKEQANDSQCFPCQAQYKMDDLQSPASGPSRSFKEALGLSGTSGMSRLRRTKAKRLSKHYEKSPGSPDKHRSAPTSSESKIPSRDGGSSLENTKSSLSPSKVRRRDHDRSLPSGASSCSVGSMDKGGDSSWLVTQSWEGSQPTLEGTKASDDAELALPPTAGVTTQPSNIEDGQTPLAERGIHKLSSIQRDQASRALDPKPSMSPVFEPSTQRRRRSSSPLKQEYDPSTASEEGFDSDTSTVEHHEISSLTDISDEEDIEDGDVPTPLVQVSGIIRPFKVLAKPLFFPASDGTLKPSDSASQAPYKTVPVQPTKSAKTIASIYSWSDAGSWQSLHPDECSIVISPGLIEAFVMSASHSRGQALAASMPVIDADSFVDHVSNTTSQKDDVQGDRPLVALELTPLVPLRRGTAIDISIRSPPTSQSQITSGNNIMFRSRNAEECEALYALINHARIHNPTYIALQNARGPFATASPFTGGVNQRPGSRAAGSRSSWFGGFGRSSSYRASSARTPSIAPSESSIASMKSAISTFGRRLGKGGGGGMFNIALSTITSRSGVNSGVDSIYTGSNNSNGSGARSPIAPGMVSNQDGSLGLRDAEIRLYIRQSASKWSDMGSARLTILQPEKNTISLDGRPSSSGGNVPAVHEKRVVVQGKTKGEILLDAQLGENCFERVGRTGIALSIWEDMVGPNGEVGVVGAVGGVAGGRAKIYMIQMKSEVQTAYTFSLVGKLRY